MFKEELGRKNVFLDFMSPDNRIIYASSSISKTKYIQLLEKALNISVFLCDEYCILPPFFPLQCELARKALTSKKEYIDEGFIRFPLREGSLDDFFYKKQQEYYPYKKDYSGLYQKSGKLFVERNAQNIIRRTAVMGNTLSRNWKAGPDTSIAWKPIIQSTPAKQIEILKTLPDQLKQDRKSVTWTGIRDILERKAPSLTRLKFEINQALQHEYTRIYLEEYDAIIIANLPPKTTDLLLVSEKKYYDYRYLKAVLKTLQLWDLLIALHPHSLIQLKYGIGYLKFINVFQRVCSGQVSLFQVIIFFSTIIAEQRIKEKWRNFDDLMIGDRNQQIMLNTEQIDLINYYLMELSNAGWSRLGEEREYKAPKDLIRSSFINLLDRDEKMSKIFIVHGKNNYVRNEIDLFLRDLGLQTILMQAGPMGGRTLPEKFEEQASDVDFAIIIATADDELIDPTTNQSIKRIRQNVILEIGYFWGALGRKKRFAILIEKVPNLEIPSDLQGIGWIEITNDLGETKRQLESELRTARVI